MFPHLLIHLPCGGGHGVLECSLFMMWWVKILLASMAGFGLSLSLDCCLSIGRVLADRLRRCLCCGVSGLVNGDDCGFPRLQITTSVERLRWFSLYTMRVMGMRQWVIWRLLQLSDDGVLISSGMSKPGPDIFPRFRDWLWFSCFDAVPRVTFLIDDVFEGLAVEWSAMGSRLERVNASNACGRFVCPVFDGAALLVLSKLLMSGSGMFDICFLFFAGWGMPALMPMRGSTFVCGPVPTPMKHSVQNFVGNVAMALSSSHCELTPHSSNEDRCAREPFGWYDGCNRTVGVVLAAYLLGFCSGVIGCSLTRL
ncbi:hypothetical protein Nepgr_033794 [Nepenthes gracilis]|uniref:Uncharacterized protein n=1 Tax=Nepenthes gracilis TaxID=150966 RepID=A0AAD3Y8M5_NEPGR|nr:hypothetical protein Nepgr_033794 [Nepenthes gracilis]